MLPDGTRFSGPGEFRQALLMQREQFVNNFTQRLLTYALGRAVQHYDMPAVRAIMREAASSEYRWSALVLGIAGSQPFQMRKAREQVSVAQQ